VEQEASVITPWITVAASPESALCDPVKMVFTDPS
jgi:hypothetical protein